MKQKEQTFTEKRHPIICSNCGTQMVSMNKYITLKDNRELYIWYVCPRRKETDEKGCGHKIPIEIKKIMDSGEADLICSSRLVGEVRSTEGITMLIQENFETFSTWLHHNREKFSGKKVEITIRIVE